MAAAQDGAPSEEHINDEPLIPVPELRVVLLGGSWSQRMSVGNFILGDDYFKVPNFVGISRRVEKNKLTVINTLDLDSSAEDKLEEFLHEFKTISAPGPHVFLLVIQPEKFTEKDRNRMCCVLQTFSDQSFEHSLIMILKPNKYSAYSVTPYVNKPALQELIKKCKCRCLEQKNLELKELLGQIGQIVKEKNLEHVSNGAASMLANDSKRLSKQVTNAAVAVNAATDGNKEMASGMSAILRHSFSVKPNVTCLNLVLCGRREPVKTSAARAILGQTDLPSASNSSGCVRNQGEVCGRWVSVVELPALYGKAQQEVMEESFRCISLCEPEGVHAFILVLPVGPLTDEDKGELQTIQDTFSSRVNDFTMILFTVESDPTAGDVNFIETDRNIQELLQSCGGRYVVLNIEDRQQIPELMEMVETISNKGSRFFTNYMFTSVLIEKTLDEFQDLKQKCLMQGEDNLQSIEKLRKEIEDMKKREEEEKKKHRDEIEALQAQLEQERKQKVQLVNETDESMEQHCEKIEKEAEKEARTFQKALQHQKGDALEEQADVEQCQREASEKQMKENDITEQMKQKQQLQSSPSLPEDVSKNPVCPTTATSGQMENGTQTSDTDNTGEHQHYPVLSICFLLLIWVKVVVREI
ncbi:PREDICTED: GTPase IMAP family member 8-like isoform X2 [Cyprinodon variegatus]|uniref:GTPase IMAP family member 8-like isoform X2 n=1 Tax=Cyprinodon variegatus TaxID=28743 RepID=UPI0007425CCD|nr:PREDICTED: GTPase IMAP family member 8-like isoform X2 [Cyprinodon variegatus]